MSEKHRSHEVHETAPHDQDHSAEIKHHNVDVSHEKARQAEKLSEARADRNEAFKESVEKHDILAMLNSDEQAHEQDFGSRPVGDDLRQNAFSNEIRHIRRKLSKPDRLGSKLIHQPIVKTVSEVSSKTITRPSGLLGGGIAAFIGTSTYLYLTKHIGLKYNYSIFLFLLVAGFVLGLVIEAVLRVSHNKRSA